MFLISLIITHASGENNPIWGLRLMQWTQNNKAKCVPCDSKAHTRAILSKTWMKIGYMEQ